IRGIAHRKAAIDLFSDEAKGGPSLQAIRVKQCPKESLERETAGFGLQGVEGIEVASERSKVCFMCLRLCRCLDRIRRAREVIQELCVPQLRTLESDRRDVAVQLLDLLTGDRRFG